MVSIKDLNLNYVTVYNDGKDLQIINEIFNSTIRLLDIFVYRSIRKLQTNTQINFDLSLLQVPNFKRLVFDIKFY